MEILRKMSVGAINGVNGGFKDVTETRHVARIMGIVRGVETKETNIGRSYKFTGEFRGINEHGEEFSSPVCYLPNPADAMLVEGFTAANGQQVGFAFDVFVTPKPKRNSVDLGYEYKIKPLFEAKPSDPLAALIESVGGAPKLAAPKPAEPKLAAPHKAEPETPTSIHKGKKSSESA
jgi:hypothetical protein